MSPGCSFGVTRGGDVCATRVESRKMSLRDTDVRCFMELFLLLRLSVLFQAVLWGQRGHCVGFPRK